MITLLLRELRGRAAAMGLILLATSALSIVPMLEASSPPSSSPSRYSSMGFHDELWLMNNAQKQTAWSSSTTSTTKLAQDEVHLSKRAASSGSDDSAIDDEDDKLSLCKRQFYPTEEDDWKDIGLYYTKVAVVPIEECDHILASYEKECEDLESKGDAVSDYLPGGSAGGNGNKSTGTKQRQGCSRCATDKAAGEGAVTYVQHRAGQFKSRLLLMNESSPSDERLGDYWSEVTGTRRLNATHMEKLKYVKEQPYSSSAADDDKNLYSSKKGHCCKATRVNALHSQQQQLSKCMKNEYPIALSHVEQVFARCMEDCKKNAEAAIQGAGCDGTYASCMVPFFRKYSTEDYEMRLYDLSCSKQSNVYAVEYKGISIYASASSADGKKFINCFNNAPWLDNGPRPPRDDTVYTTDESNSRRSPGSKSYGQPLTPSCWFIALAWSVVLVCCGITF